MSTTFTMSEEKPKTGRIEFDVKRQLWIVFNGKEWVEAGEQIGVKAGAARLCYKE